MADVKQRRKKINKNRLAFFIVMLAFPVTQFAVFYIFVNFNSVLLSFREYTGSGWAFAGIKNFKQAWQLTAEPYFGDIARNSLVMLALNILMLFLSCGVSFLVFRKTWCHGFFKVMLFLPSVLAPATFVLAFRYFVLHGLPELTGSPKTAFILRAPGSFYTIYGIGALLSFGGIMMVFLGTMGSIEKSLFEYGRTEGLSAGGEFRRIIFPHVWPMLISYAVLNFAGFFPSYGLLLLFYEPGRAETSIATFGLKFIIDVRNSGTNYYYSPVLAATGLIYTAITAPAVFGVKFLMERLGPKE